MGEEYEAKVFRSGNSVALRLPKALGLKDGDRMRVHKEQDDFVLRRADAPKRKFNIAKVAGSAASLKPIPDGDRLFDERPLVWPEPSDRV